MSVPCGCDNESGYCGAALELKRAYDQCRARLRRAENELATAEEKIAEARELAHHMRLKLRLRGLDSPWTTFPWEVEK